MDRPLEWYMRIRPHSRVAWNRRIQRFEVHEIDRILQAGQFLCQCFAYPDATRLHGRVDAILDCSQREIVRDLADQSEAKVKQFLPFLLAQPGKTRNVVLR